MSSISDVLANQQLIASAIENLFTNFKKDGASRKTVEYIKKRLDLLDSYWFEYERNFMTLLQESGNEPGLKVTIDKDKERVKERYDTIRSIIQNYQEPSEERVKSPLLKPPSFVPQNVDSKQETSSSRIPSTVSSLATSKTEEMLKKQTSHFKAFHRTLTGIDLESVTDKWEFEDLLRTVQTRWDAIDSLHWDLDSHLEGSHEEYEKAFSSYERKYQAIKKAINQKMWSTIHRDKSTPKIEIPTFSGNYQHWVSFKDLFNETIHKNSSISPAQKMQHLKSKVKGEAERLIQHLTVSSENYSTCWDILNQRYNNKKLIFTSHMNILMSLPTMQHQSLALIKRMHDTTQECLNAIKNLGVDIVSWDPIVVYLLSQKLDTVSYTDYLESVKNPRELPNLEEFMQFLEAKFTSLESLRRKQETPMQKTSITTNKVQNINQHNQKPTYYKTSLASNKNISKTTYNKNNYLAKHKCSLCNSDEHGIYFCKQFLNMTPFNRIKTVSKLNLCRNCLVNHQGQLCYSEKVCRDCGKKHNSLLHEAVTQSSYSRSVTRDAESGEGTSNQSSAPSSADTNITSGKQVRGSSNVSLQDDPFEVLLPTALVQVQARDGTYYTLRALLDQGSQTSLITEHAAQFLQINRKKCNGVISGIGDKSSYSKGIITIKCASLFNDFTFETEALVMNQLIKNLPSQSMSKPDWSYLDHIKLADPEFYKSRPVDILLGAEIYSIILMDGIYRAGTHLPTAQQTQLGWILSGNVKSFQCNVLLNNIEQIQRFWEIEDVTEQSDLSQEDKQCVEYYQATTLRREDKRYEVRIPFKQDYKQKLGLSKSRAIAQFYKLENKLRKNPSIDKEYKQFMNEYLLLGHMIPTTINDCNKNLTCYLPHHCVTRDESTTTKLRVVFNASDKTSTGLSLNDIMCRGPNLQKDLQSLLIKWRMYQYAITADIEKMFRQIVVNEEDQYLQMIIWRDQNGRLQEYRLTTVTYGTKAAPFIAMMTLKQLAYDEKINYPDSMAPNVLAESFFCDDLMYSTHSLLLAKRIQTDLISLLKSAGFNLRKWKSNSPELLEHVTTDNKTQHNFDFKQAESTKALGLGWNPQLDCFLFDIKISESSHTTKRTLLSDISRIFDPLGWLSPLTTKLKILFQDIWRSKLEWDQRVPQNIYDEWSKVKQELPLLKQLKISRWLKIQDQDYVELHGFCDASTKAYGCSVYCKIKRGNDISIVLVAGKTKVVPLNKKCSLPRLELCGAVLLSKLMDKIKECLSNHRIITYGWVDSMVVLGWLNGEVDRWKPFVANRVKQVTGAMPAECWRYVASKENPADCASRGLSVSQLIEHKLWWSGPKWLHSDTNNENNNSTYSTNLETQNKQVNVMLSSENLVVKHILEKQSSLSKAIRIIAWILRLKNKKNGFLSSQELNKARYIIIRSIQQEEFLQEIMSIQDKHCVSSKSKIYNLNPILDENNIIRVGGRLRHANLDADRAHPVIIPSGSRLADLIIDQAHDFTFHGGARLTTAYVRQKYWLTGGNNATKKRIRLCVRCRREKPNLKQQLMGDLPIARTSPSRPFYHCGVDYTGHVNVKANKGRGIKTTKGYVAVFVCMATKAVHIELVSDLTTSSFLAALRRMSARRGTPRHMYSDQGKNFIGADRVLKQELAAIQATFDTNFMAETSSMGIDWHFNAPSWPSAGGLWEAAVKSLKHHLRRVLGEQHLTYEEFATLLSQLEGCLNSRPLCPLSEDPDDLNFLTPSHFLASGPILTLYNTEKDLRTRWYLIQKIYQDIWKRWRDEYLTSLTARSKWNKPQANLKINDVVTIKDDNLPPGKWSLGRVVELHPGKDGYVRVVTLKTANGFMKRPVVKLSVLPVYEKEISDEEERQPSPRLQKINFCKFISTSIYLLLCFLIILPPIHGNYQISSLQGNNSIYFDHFKNLQLIKDDWRLVVYYNTQPYINGHTVLNKYVKYLEDVCTKIQQSSHCGEIMLQLHHEVIALQYYNDLLMNHNVNNQASRRRRGLIDGVGYIANSLFGVLDSRFAEKYTEDINLIRKNQKHLASLWKNQTSVVEAELRLLKNTEDIINQQHKFINRKFHTIDNNLNILTSEIQNITLTEDFISTAMIANSILSNLKSIHQTLLDTVTNIYNGKFNFHLLSPNQLRYELGVISEQLPKDLSLPIKKSDSLSEIYNLLQVQASVIDNYIIFEIKIPLLGEDVFEILRLIPVPRRVNKYQEIVVVPVSKYVAVNLKQDAFIIITDEQLKSCFVRNAQLNLCHIKSPIHVIKNDYNFCETAESRQCLTKIKTCSDRWIELNKINTYFYFCCETCHIKLICADQITPLRLTKTGFFHVNQECTIKLADSFFYSHRQGINQLNISSDIQIPEFSQINHIINISLPYYNDSNLIPYNNFSSQYQDIDRNIQIMKKTEPLLEGLSNHDVHHYVAIYIIFAIMGLCLAALLGKRVRRFILGRRSQAPSVQQAASQPQVATTSVCSTESDKCSEVNELQKGCNRARVSFKRLMPEAKARVLIKDTGSSPIVFHSGFQIPQELKDVS